MKSVIRFRKIFVLLVSLLMVAMLVMPNPSFPSPQSNGQDEQAIRGLIKAFVNAWNQDDDQALVKLFIQDGELDAPTEEFAAQSRKSIRKILTHGQKELFQNSTLKKDIRKILFHGQTQATVEGSYELAGIEPGIGLVEVGIQGDYTFFLEKIKHKWLIKKCDIRQTDNGL